MNKEKLRKGMLLREKSGEDGKIYRLLDLKEKVLVIDCVKKTMPVWKTYEELSIINDYLDSKEIDMDSKNIKYMDLKDFRYSSIGIIFPERN